MAHLLDSAYTHHIVLLGLPCRWRSQDDANQAKSILTITTRYHITKQLGRFMMDNASNNDTLITALNVEVAAVSSEQRQRCGCYIINLVVKEILYGEGVSEGNEAIIRCCSDFEAFELWSKFGALGRVHNIVKYIMRCDLKTSTLCYPSG